MCHPEEGRQVSAAASWSELWGGLTNKIQSSASSKGCLQRSSSSAVQHILQLIPIQHGVILGCISLHLNVKSFIPILCLYHDIHLYTALMCLCMAYFYWKSVIDTRNAVLTCLV